MADDEFVLKILRRVVQRLVILYDVVLPDLVRYRVVPSPVLAVLELVCVLIREREVYRRAVLDRAQERFLGVALHVERLTRDRLRAVEHDAHERDGARRVDVFGRRERNVGDDVGVIVDVRVSAGDHHGTVILFRSREKIGRDLLAVFAVIRVALVEVGVKIRSERRQRDRRVPVSGIVA